MEYTLRLSAIIGDIVPLWIVAHEMAWRVATAGGTPFHKPTFDGRLTGHILMLREEVRCGRLPLCDDFGAPIDVDPNIGATEYFGHEKTKQLILGSAKLKALNEWAAKRGDSFSLSHVGGWIDERGFIVPDEVNQQQKTLSKKPRKRKAQQKQIVETEETWIASASTICDDLRKQFPHFSQERISEKAQIEMNQRHAAGETGMTGRGDKVPSAGSIRRQAFKKSSR
jgi:hypothetical protein